MKYFAPILVAAFILVAVLSGVVVVARWVDSQQPAWEVEAAAKAVMNVKDYDDQLRNEAERRAWFTEFYRVLWVAVLVAACGATIVYGWKVVDERTESKARMVDGSFALTTFRNAQGQTYLVDPNKTAFGVFGFDKASGQLITDAQMIGPDRQLAYVQGIQRTRTAQAQQIADIRNSAQAKLAAGYYDRPQKMLDYDFDDVDDQPAQLAVAPWQPLSLQDAFAQSTASRWILGQSPTNGALFELNPKEAAHYGIVGATGTGKTAYTALLLMAYALKNKYRVAILDGKGGADWSKYQGMVEYASLDYTNVGGIVGQMMIEYEKRQRVLNQYGVNSIWELPAGTTKPRPTLFIVDEFGSVMDSLKAASKTAYKSVELDLGNLLRLSRGAGLYVVLCDQNPSKWPGTVRANLPMNLCYRLGGGIGNAVQEYNLDRLERVGQFQVSNEIYNAFPAYQAIGELLPDGSYKKPLALLTVDTSIVDRGGDRAANPTPKHDTSIDTSIEFTPVDDTSIDTSEADDTSINQHDTSIDTGINAPRLTGKPVSAKERALVVAEYKLQGSINKTCAALYGSMSPSRKAWIKEIVQAGGLLQ